VSATSVKLLLAAVELSGGSRPLAGRLGISEMLLADYLTDCRDLPDSLLLQVVDIVLADRQPLGWHTRVRPVSAKDEP
jgi:hypothetical protein